MGYFHNLSLIESQIQSQIQVGWNVGHNLTIGGRELPYSGTHLKGIVTDAQVGLLWLFLGFAFGSIKRVELEIYVG